MKSAAVELRMSTTQAVVEVDPPWVSNVRVNEGIINTNGLSNAITTTKYNVITWLPKSLWEQFRRIANVYFLLISLLMLVGTYDHNVFTTPIDAASTVATLCIVMMVTSVKEGMEDLDRAKSDTRENIRKVTIVTFNADGSTVETIKETQEIKSGDIIKMTGLTQVPADMLLIMSSLYSDGNQCYVETANIDGETNLKLKEAPAALKPLLPADGRVPARLFSGNIEFEPPNKHIHNFVGAYHIDGLENPIALGADNLLLRSSLFSNTEWAYGIAIYTGQETKIQMNNRNAPSKMSKIEDYVNKAIICIFIAQLILVSVAVISLFALNYQDTNIWYLYPPTLSTNTESVLPLWLELWLTFFVLFNNFIPISLYVTIELVNLGQAYLIANDGEIYDLALDCPCQVRSSNLCPELGLVSNVFSDKTGTLTRNEMIFDKCIVGGKLVTIRQGSAGLPSGIDLNNKDSLFYAFLMCLTTCHTVIREKNGTYRAESPDELALVEGVEHFQCGLKERGTTSMTVDLCGKLCSFEVFAVNAFNSDRKRMSILIKENATGKYYLMCKGADSIMIQLCAMSKSEKLNVDKSLLDLACMGLRTLCVARKVLSEHDALAWLAAWKNAASSLQGRAEKLAAVAESVETDMELLGITAIEDRLQDEVPEVIAELAKAGIVLWMLTGDKEETAINIGHSCNLLTSTTKEFFLTRISSEDEYAKKIKSTCEEIEALKQSELNSDSKTEIALVMDGPSFNHFKDTDTEQRQYLLRIGVACRSVIACRLTPLQKQQLVNVVKVETKPKATCLSIGDGANDVSMIREADVGVGIFGKEGRQAANNADFAIGQFKFLRRLLLVHGRWNYHRISKVFLYSMHKNLVITLTLFWFGYLSMMSGQSMYSSWIYSGYNFALGLPIVFYGIMDRDIPAEFALAHPQVYRTGLKNSMLSLPAIGKWVANALMWSVILCLLFFNVVGPTYREFSIFEMGTMIYFGLVLSLQLKVGFIHYLWTKIHFWSMFISISALFLVVFILNASDTFDYDFYGVVNHVYASNIFWFWGFWSGPLMCLLLDFIGQAYYVVFAPTDEGVFREAAFLKANMK